MSVSNPSQAIGGVGGAVHWILAPGRRRRRRHVRKRGRYNATAAPGGGRRDWRHSNSYPSDSRRVWRRRGGGGPMTNGNGKDGGFGGGGGGGGGLSVDQGKISRRRTWGMGRQRRQSAVFGGNGAGLGGAVFVQQGGSLTFGGTLDMSRMPQSGAKFRRRLASYRIRQPGLGAGAGLFLQGNGSFTFNPGAGQTQTVADAIADQTGVAKTAELVARQERRGHDHSDGSERLFRRNHDQRGHACRATPAVFAAISSTTPRSSSIRGRWNFRRRDLRTGRRQKTGQRRSGSDGRQHLTREGQPSTAACCASTTDNNLGAAGRPDRVHRRNKANRHDRSHPGGYDDQPAPRRFCSSGGAGGVYVTANPIIWSGVISGPGAFSGRAAPAISR